MEEGVSDCDSVAVRLTDMPADKLVDADADALAVTVSVVLDDSDCDSDDDRLDTVDKLSVMESEIEATAVMEAEAEGNRVAEGDDVIERDVDILEEGVGTPDTDGLSLLDACGDWDIVGDSESDADGGASGRKGDSLTLADGVSVSVADGDGLSLDCNLRMRITSLLSLFTSLLRGASSVIVLAPPCAAIDVFTSHPDVVIMLAIAQHLPVNDMMDHSCDVISVVE